MRLASALALELLVAAGALAGVLFSVSRAAELAAGASFVTPAVAAERVRPAVAAPLERAALTVAVPRPAPPGVFGAADATMLAPLGATPIVKTKINHGGTSLSLRLDFASGARAAFKPEQIYEQSDPRKEVAAFALDRLLQIGRIAPAKWGSVTVTDVLAGVDREWVPFVASRLRDEALAKNGVLSGELSWWIPELVPARIDHLPLDEREGRERWSWYLSVGARIPADDRELLRQLATLILFDALVDNNDRWSGSNLQMSADGRVLYAMDNTLSFSPNPWIRAMPLQALHRVQVFPRAVVQRFRLLDRAAITAAMVVADGSGGRTLLTADEITAVLARRDSILAYIDQLVTDHGAEVVLSL